MRIDPFPIAQSKGVPGVYTGSHSSLGTTYMIVVKSKQALIVTDRLKGVSEDMRLICVADASASRANTFTGKAYPVDNSEWSSVLAIASGVNTGEADAEEFYVKALAEIQEQESAGVCDFRL